MAKDNGGRLWNLVVWVATTLAVALATLVFLWVNSVHGATADNHDEIEKMKVGRAVIEIRLLHIQDGIEDLKLSVGRLEDKFETKPE